MFISIHNNITCLFKLLTKSYPKEIMFLFDPTSHISVDGMLTGWRSMTDMSGVSDGEMVDQQV